MEFATIFALIWGIIFGWQLRDLAQAVKDLVETYRPYHEMEIED